MSRPKIPSELKFTVIYKSARTCCVCRDPKKGFQIHHIDEDNTNNVESNLIVLCLGCHDEAHTKRQLSQNLTKKDLYQFKEQWEQEVKDRVLNSMLAEKNKGASALWTYINHTRLPSLLNSAGIAFEKEAFDHLKSIDIIDRFGIIQPTTPPKPRRKISVYDSIPYEKVHYAHYMYNDAIERLIMNVNPIDIDAIWKRRELRSLLKPGIYLYSLRGCLKNRLLG